MLVGIHIVVAFMIISQPLLYKAHEAVSPNTLHSNSLRAKLVHLSLTVFFVASPFVVANLIPFFDQFQGIIAAFAASPIVFFFPAYFYMKSAQKAGDWLKVHVLEKAWIWIMMCVLFPFCFLVGLAAAFYGIINNYMGGQPFTCVSLAEGK